MEFAISCAPPVDSSALPTGIIAPSKMMIGQSTLSYASGRETSLTMTINTTAAQKRPAQGSCPALRTARAADEDRQRQKDLSGLSDAQVSSSQGQTSRESPPFFSWSPHGFAGARHPQPENGCGPGAFLRSLPCREMASRFTPYRARILRLRAVPPAISELGMITASIMVTSSDSRSCRWIFSFPTSSTRRCRPAS
jgi:hypothetical protein